MRTNTHVYVQSFLYFSYYSDHVGRDSSVGIATRYGLDGPGIESRWRRDFLHPSRPALGPTQPPIQWVPGLSLGVKRPGRGADPPPPSKCRGQERVGLHLYSPFGPSWPVIGRTFTFTFTFTILTTVKKARQIFIKIIHYSDITKNQLGFLWNSYVRTDGQTHIYAHIPTTFTTQTSTASVHKQLSLQKTTSGRFIKFTDQRYDFTTTT